MPRQPEPRWDSYNQRWRCRYRGKSYNLGKSKPKAFAKLARIVNYQVSGKPGTVAELIVYWLKQHPSEWAKNWLNRWMRYAGLLWLDELEETHLQDYAAFLSREGLGQTTRRNYLKIASRVLSFAKRRRWLPSELLPPILPRARRTPRDIPAIKLTELIAALPKRTRPIFLFCLLTGARPGEACWMKWADVRLDESRVVLTRHKSGTSTGLNRVLHLQPAAKQLVSTIDKESDASYVFTSRLRKPYTPAGLRSILRRRGYTPYQLRHTFAQHALDDGVAMEDVAALLGHSGLSQVQIYAQVRAHRVAQVAKALRSPLQDENGSRPDDKAPRPNGQSTQGQCDSSAPEWYI